MKIISSHAHKARILINVFLRASDQYPLGSKKPCLLVYYKYNFLSDKELSLFICPTDKIPGKPSTKELNFWQQFWNEYYFGPWKVFRWILTKNCNLYRFGHCMWHVFTIQKWLPTMWSKSALIKVLSTTKSNYDQYKNAIKCLFLKISAVFCWVFFSIYQFHCKKTSLT